MTSENSQANEKAAKVLLVEDDPQVRKAFHALLQVLAIVITVKSG